MKVSSRFLLLIGFLVFALAPLTAPGYFIYAHDARHSVYFLQMFDLAFRDGAWYPRWATDMVFGYGYPLWLILAPIPFFAGQAFHLVGLDFVGAVKLVDGLSLFFSALAMYLFASRVLNRNAALVAALVYAYVPYHLVDLYVRSAQAELVAYVFPPLVFWAFYQLATTRRTFYVPLAALGYAGLVLSHIQSAVLFTPIIGFYLLVLLWKARNPACPRNWSSLLHFPITAVCAIALGLGIAAVFLIPVLFESRFLTQAPLIGGFFSYQKHFVNASQFLSPFWGYGYAGENGNDQFSLQLGLVPVFLALLAMLAWRSVTGSQKWHIVFFALVAVGTILAMLPLSANLWEPFAGIIAYVQFPWRLLIITGLAIAFLSGAGMYAFKSEEHADQPDLVPALAVGLLLVTANYAYTEPQHTEAIFNYQTQMEFEVQDRELLGDTIWMTGDRPQDSPLVNQYTSGLPLTKAVGIDENAKVEMVRHGGQSDTIRVEATTSARVMFYTRYFPGWSGTLDGQPIALEPYGEQGLILVRVPAGTHLVQIRYEGTTVQQLGMLISALCLIITAVWIVKTKGQR